MDDGRDCFGISHLASSPLPDGRGVVTLAISGSLLGKTILTDRIGGAQPVCPLVGRVGFSPAAPSRSRDDSKTWEFFIPRSGGGTLDENGRFPLLKGSCEKITPKF